ncbi:MAG: MerR family transcriptional regulator [Gemmatimonadaceae bacterium]
MKSTAVNNQLPIGAVARRTGLSVHVLRAWERRYKAVSPIRSEGGSRLYSQEDVDRLVLLRQVTELDGFSIAQVASYDSAALDALLNSARATALQPAGDQGQSDAQRHLQTTLDAVESLDGSRVYASLMRAVVSLSSRDFVDELAVPLLHRIGDLWANESICPVHERLLSVNMRRVLAWVIDSLPAQASSPTIVTTTPSQQHHELGAMLAGIVAAEEGWNVAYLGPDLPLEDVVTAVRQTGASVAALSIVYAPERDTYRRDIESLRGLLPDEVSLIVGGSGAMRAGVTAGGITPLQNFASLREFLRSHPALATASA